MNKLTLKQKHWLLSAHIIFAALWTGTVFSMFLLSWSNSKSTNADILYALHSAVNLLDDYVVIPAAIGSVLTATFLCWMTNYGFTKFWWVISKWFLSISLINRNDILMTNFVSYVVATFSKSCREQEHGKLI